MVQLSNRNNTVECCIALVSLACARDTCDAIPVTYANNLKIHFKTLKIFLYLNNNKYLANTKR